MPITGSQPAYSTAQGGVMRGASSRGNVTTPLVYVFIDGVLYSTEARATAAEKVRDGTLVITKREGDTPNAATFDTDGFVPQNFQEVVIQFGSINNLDRLFGGLILTDTTAYVGIPANWHDKISAIGFGWHLTRRTITQRFTNQSATAIAQAIIALAPGFTSRWVETGLPTVDEITFTNVRLDKALTRLAERIGGRWKETNYKDVVFGLNPNPLQATNPTTLTPASALLTGMKNFVVTRDGTPIVTRQPVEGGGSTAAAAVLPGATALPIVEDHWYNDAGGEVVSGPQRITYEGLGYSYTPEISNWHAQAAANLAQTWQGVIWAAELGLFVTVSSTANLTGVMTSPDGVTWTTRVPAIASGWQSVAWSPSLGLLVAVSTNGLVMTSPDGIAWTQRTAAENNQWIAVVWAPAIGLFVAVANALTTGTRYVMTSPDGVTWTPRTAAAAQTWLRVTWSTTLGLLVAVASSGVPNAVMTSPDGITWTTRTATGQTGFNVAWSPALNLFLITAGTQTSTSPDGITWTAYAGALPSANWRGLVWSDFGYFVALSDATTDNIAVSPDGVTWTLYTAPISATNRWELTWSPSLARLVAVGSSGAATGKIMTNSAIVLRTLTGVPPSGAGSILYTIPHGAPVNLRVVIDDLAAQAALAAVIGGGDDGIVEGTVDGPTQDGRIGETEARARGQAIVDLRSEEQITCAYDTNDKNTDVGKPIAIDLPAPQDVDTTLVVLAVTISDFTPARWPTFKTTASTDLVTLTNVLRGT